MADAQSTEALVAGKWVPCEILSEYPKYLIVRCPTLPPDKNALRVGSGLVVRRRLWQVRTIAVPQGGRGDEASNG